MKFGVAYPNTEVAGDQHAIRKFIRAARELERGARLSDGFIFAPPGADGTHGSVPSMDKGPGNNIAPISTISPK